jgi:hypothetical protein
MTWQKCSRYVEFFTVLPKYFNIILQLKWKVWSIQMKENNFQASLVEELAKT